MATQRLCTIPGCGKVHIAKKFCYMHYARFRKGTDLTKPARPRNGAQIVRDAIHSRTDECIVWPSRLGPRTYPSISINGKLHQANGYICEAASGPRPSGMKACHSCGNRACINPRHLYWGSDQQNADDAVKHGVKAKGEKIGSAKLTESDVRRIKADCSKSSSQVAREFGVSPATISAIRRKKNWKHVT